MFAPSLTCGLISCVLSDVYEGTRMARVTDLSGIKQIIQPLEDSGVLVQRTDEEVCSCQTTTVLKPD